MCHPTQRRTANPEFRFTNKLIGSVISCGLILLSAGFARAGDATWDVNPLSGEWNTAANWIPATVPNGPADSATFGLSNTTGVSSSSNTEVNAIMFNPGASAYTITARSGCYFTLSGAGIINNSGVTQTFMTAQTNGVDDSGAIFFTNSASAGTSIRFINEGPVASVAGGFILFFNTSTAGSSTFINNRAISGANAGVTFFFDSSTADSGTFTNNGAATDARGGSTAFSDTSTAGDGTFINNGGTGPLAQGGLTRFFATSSASTGTFINNGGVVAGAFGGRTEFSGTSSAASAMLVANGGTNGGEGGQILFFQESTGGTSRVEVFGNGNLDISLHSAPRVGIGSLEGDGNVFLGANTLTAGSNNIDTTFSGVIQDGGLSGGVGGSLTKTGTGALTLSGANTYTGDTNIAGGVLKVNGSITSNTLVNRGGTLAGTGTVQGNLINTTGGTVSPGDPLGTLTVTGNYTQQSLGTLLFNIAGESADQSSLLNILGNADLHGTLDPVLLDGFVPTLGQSFTFLNYASVSGSLLIRDRNIEGAMEHWLVTYQPTEAILTVAAGNVPVPDQASTLLLMTLSVVGLLTYRCQLLPRKN